MVTRLGKAGQGVSSVSGALYAVFACFCRWPDIPNNVQYPPPPHTLISQYASHYVGAC